MDITMKCTAKRLTISFVVYDTFILFFLKIKTNNQNG